MITLFTTMSFPLLKVFVATFITFATTFSSMMMYAFQPFMVNWFFPQLNKEQIGWKIGYLGMARFLGSFSGGLFWGWLADNLGRRPSLLIGLIGSIIFGTLFGLSQTYWWALLARIGMGFSCSIAYIVIKSYLSEVLDDKQQPLGFSIYGIGIGLGRIFAPIVGGFLAEPAAKYHNFDNEFFCTYPFVLPAFISVGLYIVGFIGVFIYFEETLKKKNNSYNKNRSRCNSTDSSSSSSSDDDSAQLSDNYFHSDEASNKGCCTGTYQHILTVQKDQLTCVSKCISGFNCKKPNSDCDSPPPLKQRFLFVVKAILNRSVLSSMAVFVIASSAGFIIFEIFTLLMISDKAHGGHEMNDEDIGFCFLVVGVVDLIYQSLIYSRLVRLFGWRKLLIAGVLVTSFGIFILPWGSSVPIHDSGDLPLYEELYNETIRTYCGTEVFNIAKGSLSINQYPVLVWIVVIVPFTILMFGRLTISTTSSVLLNNSSITETRGTVNGIGFALGSLFRATGYPLASAIFAWSQDNGKGWPLNYHFSFILLSILLMTTMPILLSLPKSMETTKKA